MSNGTDEKLLDMGHLILLLAGWREVDIAHLVRQVERGEVPWT